VHVGEYAAEEDEREWVLIYFLRGAAGRGGEFHQRQTSLMQCTQTAHKQNRATIHGLVRTPIPKYSHRHKYAGTDTRTYNDTCTHGTTHAAATGTVHTAAHMAAHMTAHLLDDEDKVLSEVLLQVLGAVQCQLRGDIPMMSSQYECKSITASCLHPGHG